MNNGEALTRLEARQQEAVAPSVPATDSAVGVTPPNDEDECVCGDSRVAHYEGSGSSMWNLYHSLVGNDPCNWFQLYKRATPNSQGIAAIPSPSTPSDAAPQGASTPTPTPYNEGE